MSDRIAMLITWAVMAVPMLYYFGLLDPWPAWATHASLSARHRPYELKWHPYAEDYNLPISTSYFHLPQVVEDYENSGKSTILFAAAVPREWSQTMLGVDSYPAERVNAGILINVGTRLGPLADFTSGVSPLPVSRVRPPMFIGMHTGWSHPWDLQGPAAAYFPNALPRIQTP
ncbi:hypothetical protein [Stratiformator vulcanicus]|uniref:hypothetical protein n=1 Tax=Stratiformator vulcanicus TaxID=2527980 RepID=UPI00287735CC|nr:hypothetical protein [Stratiformator vulcanicus]